MKNTKEALKWIVSLIRKLKIPFIISGGFAANIYGSKRSLADIDIEVYDKNVFELEKHVKKHKKYGPKRYKDKEFDLILMTLNYKGQEIDICGNDSKKIFNKKTKKWEKEKVELLKATKKKIFGLIIPVIPKNELIKYKEKISRDVDIKDIKFLKEQQNN